LKIKFLADENLRRAIVLGVRRREPRISFLQAFEVGADEKNDLTVLKIAAAEERVLVSHDIRTMPRHFREFTRQHSSPGLILVPQRLPISVTIDDLVLLWSASEDFEWVNRLLYLPV
jgi:predicted nuclease of predicted toxin-antitoxin system